MNERVIRFRWVYSGQVMKYGDTHREIEVHPTDNEKLPDLIKQTMACFVAWAVAGKYGAIKFNKNLLKGHPHLPANRYDREWHQAYIDKCTDIGAGWYSVLIVEPSTH